MDWTEMIFKGSDRVWVQTQDGEPVVDDGKVTMRYSNSEVAKSYRAAASNIAPQGSVPAKSSAAKKTTQTPHVKQETRATTGLLSEDHRLVWKSPEGEIIYTTERPIGLEKQTPAPADVYEFHTDGACSKNPGPCGWGWVLRHNDSYMEARQFLGTGTNNIAEFAGIKAALDHVTDLNARVRIYTDSGLAIGIFTQNWKAKENIELVNAVRERLREFKTKPELIKIKGHAGHLLNERADTQATSSLRS